MTNNRRGDTSCCPNQHQKSRDRSGGNFKSMESSWEEGDESSWEERGEEREKTIFREIDDFIIYHQFNT